jgi:hypothetical protein
MLADYPGISVHGGENPLPARCEILAGVLFEAHDTRADRALARCACERDSLMLEADFTERDKR